MTESPIRTVVIAEDDQATKDGLEMSLEIEGYRVLTASDGKAALALLPHLKPPCLLLLDLLMPEMTGFELLERKNLDPSIAWIPVVVLSGMENQHLQALPARPRPQGDPAPHQPGGSPVPGELRAGPPQSQRPAPVRERASAVKRRSREPTTRP
jgi:CheY-like chemotaxis protein